MDRPWGRAIVKVGCGSIMLLGWPPLDVAITADGDGIMGPRIDVLGDPTESGPWTRFPT